MSKKITLETANDVATVWGNWHQDVLLIIKEGQKSATNDFNNGAASGDPEVLLKVFESIVSLIEEPPIKAEYSIDTEVMVGNANIILDILG